METAPKSAQKKPLEQFACHLQKRKLISIGVSPAGYISIGLVPMGVIAIGVVPMGVISFGVVAMGTIASGLVSMGIISVGAQTMGLYSPFNAQTHNHQGEPALMQPDTHDHHH